MFCAPSVTVRVRFEFVQTALVTANAPSTLNVLDSWMPVSVPIVAVVGQVAIPVPAPT